MNIFTSPKPEQVFTPRKDPIHPEMYISRPDLESALRTALRVPKHVVIHGESGSGKSWLYKNVFKSDDVQYEVINLGRVSALGSIEATIEQSIGRMQSYTQSGYEESKEAEIGVGVASATVTHTKTFDSSKADLFAECLKLVRSKAGNKVACLVFENLEQILENEGYVRELGGLLLLVDDDNYSKFDIKIILVGTSNDIRSYITKATKSNTITNRLSEIPEVSVVRQFEISFFL